MARQVRLKGHKQGLAFYSTALIITIFAAYSIVRSFAHDHGYSNPSLLPRGLDKRDQECRFVHRATDQCAFVRANCPDEEAGLVSYLQLYYCRMPNAKPVAFIILVTWISMLFSTIGIAASDFLCINLSTIAAVLGMSESLTGVTFLAFGNGSPDVFSTFAAMSSNSGSLAVGELMGAACFITAVVAGSMALVKPFQVARKSFVRDVGFFTVAASFSLVFLADGSLRLWECIAMIAFYVFYVVFVVVWHWWLQRQRRIRLSETAARSHHHIPDQQELDLPEDDEDEESRPAGERTALLRDQSYDSIPTLLTPVTPAWKIDMDEDDESRDRYLAELQSNMRVSRPLRGERRNTLTPIRPSLIGALEFRSILSSLEKKSTNIQPIILRRYSDDSATLAAQGNPRHSLSQPALPLTDAEQASNQRTLHAIQGRSRAVSANDAAGLRFEPGLLDPMTATPETAIYSPNPMTDRSEPGGSAYLSPRPSSPQLVRSPSEMSQSSSPATSYFQKDGLLAPPRTAFHRPNFQGETERSHEISPAISPRVPTLQLPDPDRRKSPLPRCLDSPVSTPSHSRAPSIRLPPSSMSIDSTRDLELLQDMSEDEECRTFNWWPYRYLPSPQVILSSLFPTLYGWRDKSIVEKSLGLVTAPPVFLLTITLPVVEPTEDLPEKDPALLSPEIGQRSRSQTGDRTTLERVIASSKATDGTASPHPHNSGRQPPDPFPPRDWKRWLLIVQIFTAPFFVFLIVWANLEEHTLRELLIFMMASAVFSLVALLILLATTSPDHEPSFRPLFCFLGFAVAIAWISTIANEVVGVLKALGVILGISDAILGLTIFAVGNSLGDLVADITVAKLGYPVMALSACFGGPMLNILLGIGIGGAYMTIHKSQSKHHKHPDRPIHYKPYELEVSTTLIISGVTLLVTLLGLLIVVPLNGWRMDRKIGAALIAVWTLSTAGNVLCEILGIGSSWESVV